MGKTFISKGMVKRKVAAQQSLNKSIRIQKLSDPRPMAEYGTPFFRVLSIRAADELVWRQFVSCSGKTILAAVSGVGVHGMLAPVTPATTQSVGVSVGEGVS